MKLYIIIFLLFPIHLYSSIVTPMKFKDVMNDINYAYKVKIIDKNYTIDSVNYGICGTFVRGLKYNFKYRIIEDYLDADFLKNTDTLTTYFDFWYPFRYDGDCNYITYSPLVEYRCLETYLEKDDTCIFYFKNLARLFRAEKCNEFYQIELLKRVINFKFLNLKYPKIYNSVKVFTFDEIGGIYLICSLSNNVIYYNFFHDKYKEYEVSNLFSLLKINKLHIKNNNLYFVYNVNIIDFIKL